MRIDRKRQLFVLVFRGRFGDMEEADVRLIEIRRRWPWFTYHRQPSVVVAYPESPRDECPVALFMHGFVQMPTGYKTMLRSIARKGIMVVAVHLYVVLQSMNQLTGKEKRYCSANQFLNVCVWQV